MAAIEDLAARSTPTPGYTVAVVAERLGVPRATLRSWSQRYGLGPRAHTRGRHRLYSEADIAALKQMLTMVQSGVSPASAATCVKDQLGSWEGTSVDEDAAELASLAQQLDTFAISELVDTSLRRRGVILTWDEVCRPAFALIVQRQVDMRCIDEEHALSWAVSGRLRDIVHRGASGQQAGIVLACTPGERHLLPLDALAAALAEASVPVRMLGSDVPLPALSDALERTRPAALLLWSHSPATASLEAVEIGLRFAGQVYVAGSGWPQFGLPDACSCPASLAEATDALVHAVAGICRAG